GGKRVTQRAELHFARKLVVVAPRLRAEHRAAVPPQRVSDFADARAAGALLPPGLLAGAADERAVLRHVRPAPLRSLLVHDGFPNQVRLPPPAKPFVLQVERPDGLSV